MTETGNQGSSYATHAKYKYREKSTDTNTKTKAQIQGQETVTFSIAIVPNTSMINDRNTILDLKIQETPRRLGLNRFQCRSVNQLHN